MHWLSFAMLAPALMTLVMFGDKYVIEKQIPDPRAVLIYLSLINVVLAVLLWSILGFPVLAIDTAVALFIAGAFTLWGNVFYFRAIAIEETSTVIVLLQLTPVITLILGFFLLDDVLTLFQLLGFSLIIMATIGVSHNNQEINKSKRRLQLSPAFWLMLGAGLIWATAAILSDHVLDQYVVDLRTLFISTTYAAMGYAIGGLILYIVSASIRQAFNQHIQHSATRATFGAIALLETVFLGRQLALFMAISLGPVALVTVLGSTSVFFGIVLGWLLTILAPAIFKEDIRTQNLVRKGLWALILFAGLLLLG